MYIPYTIDLWYLLMYNCISAAYFRFRTQYIILCIYFINRSVKEANEKKKMLFLMNSILFWGAFSSGNGTKIPHDIYSNKNI